MLTDTELFARALDEVARAISSQDPYHLTRASGELRMLLLDGTPLVHRLNREHRLQIAFSVNCPNLPTVRENQTVLINIDPASSPGSGTEQSLSLKQFLACPVIVHGGRTATVKDVLRYTAHKVGGVHFGPDDLDEKDELVRDAIEVLDRVGHRALLTTLSAIGSVALAGLADLFIAAVKPPDTIPLVAHFTSPRTGSILFEPGKFLKTDAFDPVIDEGFGWHGVLTIPKAPGVLYEMGRLSEPDFRLSVQRIRGGVAGEVTWKGAVTRATAPIRDKGDGFTDLSIELDLRRGQIELTIRGSAFLPVHAASAPTELPSRLQMEKQVLGATLEETGGANFHLVELLLAGRPTTPEESEMLYRYLMWLRWHS